MKTNDVGDDVTLKTTLNAGKDSKAVVYHQNANSFLFKYTSFRKNNNIMRKLFL